MSPQAAYPTAVAALYQFVATRAIVSAFDKVFVISAIITLVGLLPALFISGHGKIGENK